MRIFSSAFKSLLVGLAFLSVTATAQAVPCTTVCYVAPGGLDSNDGDTPGTAKLTINAAIAAVSPGGTVEVAAGAYNEDVLVNKSITLLGAGSGSTTISGPMGGDGATIRIAASGVVVDGFTITRDGNNLADWNNGTLNFAGVAIQGQTVDAEIRNCMIAGNRSGIDINNSDGNNIHDNTIDNNHTGVILRNQTDSTTFEDNVVTNNRTVGLLFLDASGGTNVPLQQALNSSFSGNTFTDNWYGGVVDRQSGGSLPAPGTSNLKSFLANTWENIPPTATTANSAEPGYASLIPPAFGGTASDPGGSFDIAGPASANIVYDSFVQITAVSGNAPEGNAGTADKDFTITRSGFTGGTTVITYSLTGTAALAEDYSIRTTGTNVCTTTSTCTFTAGQTTKFIRVRVTGDLKHEDPAGDTIVANLSGAGVGVLPPVSSNTYTILDDADPVPTISIGNRTVTEGALANFAVTLSNGSYLPVSVTATTADGTANGVATGPFPLADYTTNAPGGTPVTFAANATVLTQNVGIPTINDTVYEGGTLGTKETFFVNLSGEVNATLGTSTGNGLITDNELQPIVSVTSAASVAESAGTYAFTVSLNRQSVDTINVTATAVDGTAQQTAAPFPVADFDPMTQALTFLPGELSKTVTVTINEDAIDEATETVLVQLSSLANVGAGTISRTGTIIDNDAQPLIAIVATSSPVSEGSGTATFTITPSTISGRPMSVTAQTVPIGTAIAGVDYTVTGPNVLSWIPGDATPQTLVVPIVDDLLDEAPETFRGNLSGGLNAGLSPANADMTIADNDPIPTVSISDVTVAEGDTPSTTTASFTVSLSAASGQAITVRASTANGTATTANNDYVAQSNVQLTFSPLQTSQQFNVTVNGDNVLEVDETFVVNLSLPSATVTIADGQAVGTINNDDSPALSIGDAQVVEGNTGQVSLNFNVTIPGFAPAGGVAFDFDTSDASATLADNDYVQVTGGSGFIAAGTNSTTVSVLVNGDTAVEVNETFTVTLSNATLPSFPVGIVTILDPTATGTILNNDAVAPGALVISEFRLSGPNGINDEFIEIANTTSSPITVSTTDLSSGFSVAQAGGAQVFTIPNGTTIPARGHLLAVNTNGYSLQNYGGLNAATANRTWTTSIADDTGLALFATSNILSYGSATPLDAVGFTGDIATPYIEGAIGLAGVGGGPFVHNYSFVRKHAIGPGAALQDTSNSAADFALVAVDAGTYGAMTALLGGPSPENLAAETERSNADVAMITGPTAFTGVPGSAPKALEFRRTFVNNSAGTLNALRFKVTSITTLNSPGGVADLRPTDSAAFTSFQGLSLEGMPSAGYVLTTPPTGPYPAGVLPNGGLNSTWRLITGPVAPVGTVDVNFRVEYTASGLPYLLWVVPEAN